ncbi:RDD family protein [Altererythrobacter sp. BO-6]|uniref:RDD family protein n=1 Tax=Altererythrobacter sp. BO-6 TaxID=2604537 RepID=UPI0013E10912|nr:RDD family protein [Altererythrobacter sp. BO-6]QIG54977.1 RDD family protein [Altererythrobacter sp. BO-6]
MQGTPGKRALGLIVTDLDGGRISPMRAVGRYFAKILSTIILFIGFIMIGFTERKQGLHDMIAGTLVQKANPGEGMVDARVFD